MSEATLEVAAPAEAPQAEPRPARMDKSAASSLSGRQKAAVLLISLGTERAANILKHLSEREVEALSAEMAALWRVRPETSAAVMQEIQDRLSAASASGVGGPEYAREVLTHLVGPERAQEIIGTVTTEPETRPFEFLRRTPPDQIYGFLRPEAPQTVALVIAHLHTTLAAQVIAEFPPEDQAEIAMRIATMNETSPEVTAAVEDVIRQKLSNIISSEYAAAGGVESLAQILNHADRATERTVLDYLGESDPELAEEIRALLFVFEDLVRLDDRSVQLVLKDVESADLALALRGVSEEVKDKVLSNMSQRAAEMLMEDLAYQPPQRRSVIEDAQGRIVAVVRRLEEEAQLVIGRGGDGDEIVA
jgi:flagellar motor switch protein FliG